MIGDEVTAAAFAERLAELGVYAVSFSFPVVPRGTARIRTQMSAAHTLADLDFAATAFAAARESVPSLALTRPGIVLAQHDLERGSPAGRGAEREGAADRGRPLAHVRETLCGRVLDGLEPRAVVADGDEPVGAAPPDRDPGPARVGVPARRSPGPPGRCGTPRSARPGARSTSPSISSSTSSSPSAVRKST